MLMFHMIIESYLKLNILMIMVIIIDTINNFIAIVI